MKQDVAAGTKAPLWEDRNPIFQDIARFRSILFDAMLRPHDMTMSQGWVLVHLVRERGLRQAELAERLEVATVTTSKLIDRLEARGYVERRADPDDRRSNRVYTTPQGEAIVTFMNSTIRQVNEIANEGVSEEELRLVLNVLGRMRTNLKTALANR